MKEHYDEENGYCRSLGHHVPFRYCRMLNDPLPCGKISDCWHERLDITSFLADNYTGEERKAISGPPQSKLSTLVDLVRKASETKKTD